MKSVLRYTFYPLLMIGGLLLVHFLILKGVQPALAATGSTVVGIAIIVMMEAILPYSGKWRIADGEWTTDLKHLVLTQALLPRLMTLFWTYLFVRAAGSLSSLSLLATWWPQQRSMYVQLPLVFLVVSFGRYWAHRAGHEVSFLWKFHTIHHSSRRLYWLNAVRWNPFDKIFVSATEIIPFVVFGIKPEIVAMYTIFISLNSFMQHVNIDVRLGFLNYVFNATESHRWHHSVEIAESNTNYGNPLALWDLAFGTFLLPKDRSEPEEIGLKKQHYTKGWLDDLVYPFRQLFKLPVKVADAEEVSQE